MVGQENELIEANENEWEQFICAEFLTDSNIAFICTNKRIIPVERRLLEDILEHESWNRNYTITGNSYEIHPPINIHYDVNTGVIGVE